MLTTGTTLQNRYRIVSLLGQGGMGAVYRAWDTRLNVPVALKEMIPQPGLDLHTLAQLRQQFQQEATVLARLNHPHLVDVTDFLEEGGNTYLVMKFIEGESLADRIAREGALPESQVLLWAGQLLDALAYCHGRSIIHRDVKPQNVVITPEEQAVLVDFGLVKLWDPRDPRTRTAMRGMGTPEYASPEQYGTQPGHTNPCSDVYSLGATLYHALTGQAPPTANDRMAAPDQFTPVRGLNPRVSDATEAVVLRAMELPLASRFQSAAEMRAALRGGPSATARPAAPRRKPTKVMPGAQPAAPAWHKRISAWVWAVGGLVAVGGIILLVAAGGGLLALLSGRTQTPTGGEPTRTPRPTSSVAVIQTTIKIGLDVPMTGDFAFVGTQSQRAAEMKVADINGAGGLDIGGKKYTVELIVEDNEFKAESATAAATKLITQDQVLAIVGPQASKQAVPTGEVCNENETPMVSPWSTNPNTTLDRPWVFRACFLDPFQGPVAANFATDDLGFTKAAVLYDVASDYPKGLAEFFKAAWEDLHGAGSVVAYESFTTGDTDFSAQLTKIKGSGAEFLFTPQYYNEVPLIVKQAQELGLDFPILGSDSWGDPKTLELCGDACEGLYFSTHYAAEGATGATKEFIDRYKADYDETPGDFAALTWDAMAL